MCQAMGWALGYGGADDIAKWSGLVSEQGLLLARVWIERSYILMYIPYTVTSCTAIKLLKNMISKLVCV